MFVCADAKSYTETHTFLTCRTLWLSLIHTVLPSQLCSKRGGEMCVCVWLLTCNRGSRTNRKKTPHFSVRCMFCQGVRGAVLVLSEITPNVNTPQRAPSWQGACFEPPGTSLWFLHTWIFLCMTDRWSFSSVSFTPHTHRRWLLVHAHSHDHSSGLRSAQPWLIKCYGHAFDSLMDEPARF